MTAMVASKEDLSQWNSFQWRRKMEAFGRDDEAVVSLGPEGEIEGIWWVLHMKIDLGGLLLIDGQPTGRVDGQGTANHLRSRRAIERSLCRQIGLHAQD